MSATLPTGTTLPDVAAAYRRALAANEAGAVAQLTHAYAVSYQAVAGQVDALAAEAANLTPGQAFRLQRLRTLEGQLAEVMDTLVPHAQAVILREQAAAIRLGSDAAIAEIAASLGPEAAAALQLTRLPDSALRDLVGMVAPGTPLGDSLSGLGPAASQQVRDGLLRGMALGQGPREIARQIRGAFGGNLTSALSTARTATLYASRTAALRHMQEHEEVVTGWVWTAALGPRTCQVCWSLHGTRHKLSEPMRSHRNCRCSPSPFTKGNKVKWQDPEDEFAKLDPATQRQILGPGKLAAYQDGRLSLRQIAGLGTDPLLGRVVAPKTLAQLGIGREVVVPKPAAEPERKVVVPPDARMREFEDSVRGKFYEKAAVFDASGTEVFRKVGTENAVYFSPTQMRRMNDSVLTHNHPNDYSFSLADIHLAHTANLSQIRAVRSDGRTYTMTRGAAGWPTDLAAIEDAYQRANAQVTLEYLQRIKQGRMTIAEGNARHYDEVWRRVVKQVNSTTPPDRQMTYALEEPRRD